MNDMNNGSFNGFDPNYLNRQSGFMGGYDPNASYQNDPGNSSPYQNHNGYDNPNPYQGNPYGDVPQQTAGNQLDHSGYAPYHGGSYANPVNNPYQPPVQSSYSVQNEFTTQNAYPGTGYTTVAAPTAEPAMSMADYSKRVFLWMGAGLAITFLVALGVMLFLTDGGEWEISDRFRGFLPVFYGGIIAEIVLALVLNIFVAKMPYGVSLSMFIVYSVVSGITFSPILLVFEAGSAIFAFAAAAVLFVGFAIYGIVTKRDLMKLGSILMIGLIVLLIFTVIGIFVQMSLTSLLISFFGIAVFIGLTAYDAQKIRVSYDNLASDGEMLKKMSVNMALQLYLDFINLFIYLLRLMGRVRR